MLIANFIISYVLIYSTSFDNSFTVVNNGYMSNRKPFNFAKFVVFLVFASLLYFPPACFQGNCAGGLGSCQFYLPPENFLYTFGVGMQNAIQGRFIYLYDMIGVVLIALAGMKIDDAMEGRGYKLWSRMIMHVVVVLIAGGILAALKIVLSWEGIIPCESLIDSISPIVGP